MLIEFTVGNYKSFKDPVTFSMVAANLKSKSKILDENNTFAVDKKMRLLTSAAVYGANASGKSNLVSAISFMRSFVLSSSKDTQADEPIEVGRFRLSDAMNDRPSFFELVFLVEGQRYRYGFELNTEHVISEWLFYVPTRTEVALFARHGDDIRPSRHFQEGVGLESKTRKNALFLSVAAQFNGAIAQKLLAWFRRLGVIRALEDQTLRALTLSICEDAECQKDVTKLVKKLDLGIQDLQFTKVPWQLKPPDEKAPKEMANLIRSAIDFLNSMKKDGQPVVNTAHLKYDDGGQTSGIEMFELNVDESAGTQKLFALAGPLVTTLKPGDVLVIDELDSRLHPIVTRAIIDLFNSQETNPKHAQLIFTTQDTNLLSNKIFRRDQIWFTEKDRQGATHLYSLAEYKVRNDASFESDYIKGKYGAIPFMGDLGSVLGGNDA